MSPKPISTTFNLFPLGLTLTHTNATLAARGAIFHRPSPPSLRRLSGHQVRRRTRSASSSEVCKEVWSQCQPKSYLLDADRKGGKRVCPQSCTLNNLYYQSSCMLCAFPLLLIFYFYLSVSLVPWQAHVNSIIQQPLILQTWKETAA